jgi:hypothetical protein
MAKDPWKLFTPEELEKLRAGTPSPEQLEKLRKDWPSPEQLEKLHNCGLPPEQVEALRRHNAALYRSLQPPEQRPDIPNATDMPTAEVGDTAAGDGALATTEAADTAPVAGTLATAERPVPPDNLRPTAEEVRAKLAGRTLELAVYEALLGFYHPDGDPRGSSYNYRDRKVLESLEWELDRAVSRSALSRVLKALRGR